MATMPEDVINFSGIVDPLINGQGVTFSTSKNLESRTVAPDPSKYPQPISQSTVVRTAPNAMQQLPRDRANSVDNHVLRSLFTPGGESSSRGISSASSMSPIHPLMSLHTPQHSPIENMSQANTPSALSRSNGLLYSLLVSADSRPLSCRLKQPLAPSSSTTSSTSEPKKHKSEDSTQRFESSNNLPIIPLDFDSTFRPSSPSYHHTLLHPHSSLSSGLSSTSSDSGLDEPLDLTPRKLPTEPVQLAKKTAGPVQRNVSEFLRLAAEFVHSSNPSSMHWWEVYKATWHRLLILAIAEYDVEVVVVESPHALEHLTDGEPVLPWLNLPSDASELVPTREFAEQVLNCISEVRKQNLTTNEYAILRNVILYTATQPSKLAEVGVKTLQREREAKTGCLMDNGKAGVALYSVTCGLIAMETLSMAHIAGLFCGHLRGEASKEIFSESLRASIKNYINPPGESILVRLVCETPQPVSKEGQVAPSPSRILTSGLTSIPPPT